MFTKPFQNIRCVAAHIKKNVLPRASVWRRSGQSYTMKNPQGLTGLLSIQILHLWLMIHLIVLISTSNIYINVFVNKITYFCGYSGRILSRIGKTDVYLFCALNSFFKIAAFIAVYEEWKNELSNLLDFNFNSCLLGFCFKMLNSSSNISYI